jgi:flagellar assembly protein FliH
MTQQPKSFMFETEFNASGDVLSGPDRKYFSREETDSLAAKARAEAEAKARQSIEAKGFASVDRIAAHLSPVAAQLAEIAETLRREAAELALIAARKIAGAALDANGEEAAIQGIEDVIRKLKSAPSVVVRVAPDAIPQVERRIEQLRQKGFGTHVHFVGDAKARPGDWHVVWGEGSTGFSREGVEAALENIIAARLQDPVAPQLELFSAA